jgi:CDP-diacylglycerol--serine O-phosphatidyltransferase
LVRHLPSFITIVNLICGFLAICIADLYISSLLIIACIFLDVLDGGLARALNAQSAIGKELDSLADMVSFGVAPAFLLSLMSPIESWIKYIPPVLFLIGGCLRLAIFNTLPPDKFFKGLAIPAAASFIIGLAIAFHFDSEFITGLLDHTWFYFGVSAFMAFMMLAPIEMFSAKNVKQGPSKNVFQLLALGIFIILLLVIPRHAFWINVLSYIGLAILDNLFRKRTLA